jgi:hypothetical protein
VFSVKYWVYAAEKFPVVTEDDMLRKSIDESSEPVVGRLRLLNRHSEGISYKPRDGEVGMCPRVGRMGPIKRGWIGTA